METHNRELDELYSGTIPDIVEGTILKGKVISIKADSVVVDIGYKSEGFISIEEFAEKDRGGLSEGVEIEVYVSRIDADGLVILSPEKARRIRTLQRLEEAQKDATPVEGIVMERIKGGYNVDISGIRAFMPGSQADLKPLKNPDSLNGQEIEVRVLKFNSKLTNVIVSRRVILEEERLKLREKTLADLKPESVLSGVVKNITDYGVFVDLGGIDGLLHISDISWGRIRHPSDVFNVGQEVEVMVVNFAPETEKVTLGYKQKRSDPWLNIEEKYPVGSVVSGKVVSLTDYGAFVEIEDGVEGLVHVSELDWSPRPKHPSNYMEVGDFIDAQILKVDPKERRVSLGIKQLKPKPWKLVAERYEVGRRINGRVRSLTEFGAFIGLPEGVDALLHISDMSWTKHVRHPSEILRKGQMIEAVILSLEPEKERMALGLKQLVTDPWEEKIPADFQLGDEVKCKVLRHTEFGIFVELEGEVEGLIYSSEIDTGGKKPDEIYKDGDEIVVRIIKVEVEGRKIGLSLKTLKHETNE